MDGQSRLLVLLSIFLLAACGTKSKEDGGPARWVSLPVTIYADSSITSNSAANADLADAMKFWEARAGKKLFNFLGTWGGQTPPYNGNPNKPDTLLGNVIYLEHSWPFAQNIGAQTLLFSQSSQILSSVIMINGGMNMCTGTCSSVSERKIMAHELGHFLGLQHNNNVADIMYPEVQPGSTLDSVQIDSGALSQLTR